MASNRRRSRTAGGQPEVSVPILVLTATESEQAPLSAALGDAETDRHLGRLRVSGRIAGHDVLLLETGLGVVNTAHALAVLLEGDLPPLVLSAGIGGAYPGTGLSVGDLALADEEVYADLGLLAPGGWQPADPIGIPLLPGDPPRYNRFPLEAGLVDRARRALSAFARERGVTLAAGPFLTLQEVTGTDERAAELRRRFPSALCENMEGAAAAHLCALYGLPFVELRGISNRVGNRDSSRWDIPGAVDIAAHAALHLLRQAGTLVSSASP